MIKVRIQLGQGSAVQVTKHMLENEGVGAFYKGLSARLLRQATYTTARLGSFKILTNKVVAANERKPLPLYKKALCGLTAGAIGACVGGPADLALIRMQADATLPPVQQRNYKNAFHALYRIVADEGVLALWKGVGPTVVRAMALNMGMLASYDQSVELFRDSLGLGEVATIVESGKETRIKLQKQAMIAWRKLIRQTCSETLGAEFEENESIPIQTENSYLSE